MQTWFAVFTIWVEEGSMSILQGNTKNREMLERFLPKEGVELTRIKVLMEGVDVIAYDALFGILEIRMTSGTVWWFFDVPEVVWYQWRQADNGVTFFHTYIAGKYLGKQIDESSYSRGDSGR